MKVLHPSSNTFTNYKKIIRLSETDWNQADAYKLSDLNVTVTENNLLTDQFGRIFHHFCTTSYLGLDYHPDLLSGAVAAITEAGTLRIPNSRNRCKLSALDAYENELEDLFDSYCLSTLSCSAASSGLLPLVACGAFTGLVPPTLVFDKRAHYSMNHLKAACADETEVITAPHNDMNYLEDLCKKHKKIAYVADGMYSMGGIIDIENLLYLKDRYGLFLYLDDSHSLSAIGEQGKGYIRSHIPILDSDIIIVASLAKSFGASGGLIMFGDNKHKKLVHRYGGPSNWSQSLNTAAIGAGRASIKLHRTPEFSSLQKKLQSNIKIFDRIIKTGDLGSPSAIRLIRCGEAALASKVASVLANNGFFTSAVFFPVVPQGEAAIRITLRADMDPALIEQFCTLTSQLLLEYGVDTQPA